MTGTTMTTVTGIVFHRRIILMGVPLNSVREDPAANTPRFKRNGTIVNVSSNDSDNLRHLFNRISLISPNRLFAIGNSRNTNNLAKAGITTVTGSDNRVTPCKTIRLNLVTKSKTGIADPVRPNLYVHRRIRRIRQNRPFYRRNFRLN